MKKRILFTLIGLLLMVGILAGIKALQIKTMIDQGKKAVMPPEVVTSAEVELESWESTFTAVGSVDAVQGVTVTAEVPGKVAQIAFEAGGRVAAGDILVQQDVSVEKAQLRAAQASLDQARTAFERAKRLMPDNAVSQSDYDDARFQLAGAEAEVANIQALIDKKTIRAPFPGRLGIRHINLGQIINDGEAIVTLQALDPVFVNFLLPQRRLENIKPGLKVRVTTDSLPDKIFAGEITTIDPEIDASTRNIRVQAKLANPNETLRSGMFVNLTLVLPQDEEVMTIPATAVLHAPYSDSVFIITEQQQEGDESKGLVLKQQFVQLGEKRGDFVVVTSGLNVGDTIVSTGAFKFRNGQSVVIDNKLAPEFKLDPQPSEG